jgi:hypothetical protein
MKISAGILALIAIFGIRYAFSGWLRDYLTTRTTGKAPVCLYLAGSTAAEEEGRTYIVGSIKNNCDRNFIDVMVLFKLDRPPGPPGPLGDLAAPVASAYARDVKAGEVREFKTAVPVSRDTTYRFDGINAF